MWMKERKSERKKKREGKLVGQVHKLKQSEFFAQKTSFQEQEGYIKDKIKKNCGDKFQYLTLWVV